jgi:hypothetical protein
MPRRAPLWGLLLLATAGLVWLAHSPAPSAQAEPLAVADRPDGGTEAYYAAGDAALTTGLALLTDYWSALAQDRPELARGHVDHYLPVELKALDYGPADTLMAELAETFFATRDPQTGLIPYPYDAPLPEEPTQPGGAISTAGLQPVGLIARGTELCAWFPSDRALQRQCLDLAEATVARFDVAASAVTDAPTGLWGWVDVASGAAPRYSITLTQDYGQVALGIAHLAAAPPELLGWADQKLRFVWQHPQSPTLPLLYEQFVLTRGLVRPEEPSSDTDTLYFVRQLFELCELTDTPQYCDWALATTDVWVERAWVPQWGHFVRKLNPDGSPATDRLYGDGKYNTLAVLVDAYRATGDRAYLDRLLLAWNSLLRLGENGLAPEAVRRGKPLADQGLDPQQTIFLEILLEAYAASDDPAFLAAADALGDRILAQGESAMRLESGQGGAALLRLALARQPVARLELALPAADTQIALHQGARPLLQAQVPGTVAVIYLPEGTYRLSALGQSRTLSLRGHQRLSLAP